MNAGFDDEDSDTDEAFINDVDGDAQQYEPKDSMNDGFDNEDSDTDEAFINDVDADVQQYESPGGFSPPPNSRRPPSWKGGPWSG